MQAGYVPIGSLRVVWRVLILSVGLVSTPALAAEPGVASSTSTSTPSAGVSTPAPATAPPPVTLYDIVGALAHADRMRRDIAATLRDTSDRTALTAALDLPPIAPEVRVLEAAPDSATRVRYLELQAIELHLRDRASALNDATAALAKLTQKLVTDLDRLDRETALWPQRASLARERESPPEVQGRIEAVGPEFAALRKSLLERRDQFLVAYERALRMQAQLDSLRSGIAERRERLRVALHAERAIPIWQQVTDEFPLEQLRANTRLLRAELVEYFRKHGERIAVLFAVLTALLFVFLRRPAAVETQEAEEWQLSAVVAACGALVVALPLAFFAPLAPIIFYRLVWLPFPLLAAVVATRSFARSIPATAWTLAFALFLNKFRVVAEMSPMVNWLLLMLQIVPFGSALVYDWRRGALARFLPTWRRVPLNQLVRSVIAVLAIAAIVGLLGYGGIATGLVALAVIVPAYALAFAALAWVLDRAFAGMLSTPLARGFRSVRERRHTILRTLHGLAVLFAWVGGILMFALAYSAVDEVIGIGTLVANASVSAGDVTITAKAMLSALLVVVITWAVTKFVRFALEHEILPRINLRTGVPVAISTIVGYVLVVTGTVLAMAALGIDLTKVTLLAGALGVGVGFGLQNVINNFASGLILMLERPINVGDQIDVGGVGGEVKRIGVRSSTIRTSQGAEVVVPNADLASKQVTNWTLSDRARRYEIDVRVGYGSDPARVLRLLESAAAEVPEVQKAPKPLAQFTGFGDNSLDFRLFAWVESLDVGLQAQNNLRVAILRVLNEAGIEIPSPQRDVHIRYAPSEVGAVAVSARDK